MKMLGQDVLTQDEFDTFKNKEYTGLVEIVTTIQNNLEQNSEETKKAIQFLKNGLIASFALNAAIIVTALYLFFK